MHSYSCNMDVIKYVMQNCKIQEWKFSNIFIEFNHLASKILKSSTDDNVKNNIFNIIDLLMSKINIDYHDMVIYFALDVDNEEIIMYLVTNFKYIIIDSKSNLVNVYTSSSIKNFLKLSNNDNTPFGYKLKNELAIRHIQVRSIYRWSKLLKNITDRQRAILIPIIDTIRGNLSVVKADAIIKIALNHSPINKQKVIDILNNY